MLGSKLQLSTSTSAQKYNYLLKPSNFHSHRKIAIKPRKRKEALWIDYKDPNQKEDGTPFRFTGKERDLETGLYYYGARYLDPKTSRWMSTDPAMGEYLPSAPVNEEAKKRNGNLPGQGGVFNYVNLHVYHYAGNNPVKYVDPDGSLIIANNYAKWMFSTSSDSKYINFTTSPYRYSRSNVTYYYGLMSNGSRFSSTGLHLENIKYGSGFEAKKINENKSIMKSEFYVFSNITNSYKNAKENNRDISFSTTLVEGKFDNYKEPYYLLSMTVDGKKSDLFYFSAIEGNSKERLLNRIGEFFAAFQEGTPADWRPDANTKIQSDLY